MEHALPTGCLLARTMLSIVYCAPTPAVVRILREGVGTKVIGLNLQDNTICIYRGEQRVVKEVEDLVEAIESSPLSPKPVSSEDQAKPG